MDMHINGVYLPSGRLDVAAGRDALSRLSADQLATAVSPEDDILGYGWQHPSHEVEAPPWESDDEFLSALNAPPADQMRNSHELLQYFDSERPEVAGRYREYILASAHRWLDNFVDLVSGENRQFEASRKRPRGRPI